MAPSPAWLRPALHPMDSRPTVTPWTTAVDRKERVLIPLSLIPPTRRRCSLNCWMECVAPAPACVCAALCSLRSHQKVHHFLAAGARSPVCLCSSGNQLQVRVMTVLESVPAMTGREGGRQEYTLQWSQSITGHTHTLSCHTPRGVEQPRCGGNPEPS